MAFGCWPSEKRARGLRVAESGRTLAGRMVTSLTSPDDLVGVVLPLVAAALAGMLVALMFWLLRSSPTRTGRGGELDLTRAAARGELTSFEWDWPRNGSPSEGYFVGGAWDDERARSAPPSELRKS